MAREAYRSLYGDLTKLKDDSLLKDPASGDGETTTKCFNSSWRCPTGLTTTATAASTPAFKPWKSTAAAAPRLPVPDLVALVSLAEDVDGDDTFSHPWKAGEYWLEPYDASPAEHWGRPYTSLRVGKSGPKTGFTKGERRFRLNGAWGYRQFKERQRRRGRRRRRNAGRVRNHLRQRRNAIRRGPNGHYWRGATAGNRASPKITCRSSRGLNGTTPAAHPDGSTVYILRWPASVERAALIQAARIWTRAADFEPFYVDSDVDTDVRLLLEPYRKPLA